MSGLQQFGGSWTEQKLTVLEKYLNAYTQALKDKPTPHNKFKLMYIDAFAGTGYRELKQKDADPEDIFAPQADVQTQQFLDGSVLKALKVAGRGFDEFALIEKDPAKCLELEKHRSLAGDRAYDVLTGDANEELRRFLGKTDWSMRRAVLFLDPFATEVEWATIEKIAATNAIDTWILFPLGIVQRLLPNNTQPENIHPSWKQRLDRVFGTDDWQREFYKKKSRNLTCLGRDKKKIGKSPIPGPF